MKIVISGARGFIGRNLLEYFSTNHEVIPLSHSEVDFTDCAALTALFEKLKPDAVLHTAAKPGHRKAVDKENLTFINLLIFTSVMQAAKNAGIQKFVHYGSGSEYDMITRPLCHITEKEFGAVIPRDETGFPRYVETRLMKEGAYGYNLRCFGVYGKYEDYTMRFISNAVCKALFQLPLEIRQDKSFSYVDVWDLCRITEQLLIKEVPFGDYNAVPPFTLTMSEIAAQVVQKTGSKSEVKILGTGYDYTASGEKLQQVLGDFAFTPFALSLENLITYYKSIKEQINCEEL